MEVIVGLLVTMIIGSVLLHLGRTGFSMYRLHAAIAGITEELDIARQQAYYPCADRIPVFSTGVSFRFNLMGYAIMEAYVAHPFQRPAKNWVWGFQLAPGW